MGAPSAAYSPVGGTDAILRAGACARRPGGKRSTRTASTTRGSGERMITVDLIQPNRYQDSVTLMQVAGQVRALPGVADAALMMGTDPNKEMLRAAGLLTDEGAAAGPNDL